MDELILINHPSNEPTTLENLIPERDPRRFLASTVPLRSLVFLLASFTIGFAVSSILVLLVAMSLILSLVVEGIPMLAATIVVWTYLAQIERERVRILTDVEVPRPYRRLPEGGHVARARVFFTDPAIWKDGLYLAFLVPVGIAQFILALTAVLVPLTLLSSPIALLIGGPLTVLGIEISTFPGALAGTIAGIVTLPAAAYVITVIARSHALVARWALGRPEGRLRV